MAVGAAITAVHDVIELFGQLNRALTSLPDRVRSFVDALNPSVGERFDYALRGLNATIGYALEPILLTATRIVDEFSGALSAGMDRLRRPIEQVSGLFAVALRPALEAVRNLFVGLAQAGEMLAPVLPLFGTAMEGLAALFNVGTVVLVETLLDLLRSWIPSGKDLASMTDELKATFVALAVATLRVTAFMLNLAGRGDVMRKVFDALLREAPPRAGRQGMPQGFALGGIEDVYRKRLLAAAQAGGRGVDEQQLDVQREIRDAVREMAQELKDNPKEFEEKTNAFMDKLKKGIFDSLIGPLRGLMQDMGLNRLFGRNQP